MQSVAQVINQQQSGQTRQSQKSSVQYSHTEERFVFLWRGLQSGKHVPLSWVVDGTDYKYWRYQLRDFTNEDCTVALEVLRDYLGEAYKLTWSGLRNLVSESRRREPAHRMFLPSAVPARASREVEKNHIANLKKLFQE